MNAQSGFVKTTRTAPRREAAEQEAFKARKGKMNKTKRGNTRWEDMGYHTTTAAGVEALHVRSIESGGQKPKWEYA